MSNEQAALLHLAAQVPGATNREWYPVTHGFCEAQMGDCSGWPTKKRARWERSGVLYCGTCKKAASSA